MNGQVDLTQFAQEKYAVGQPVPRKEDPTLLRGQGRYTDDLNLPGQAHAVMVRSTIAHGIIRAIDTTAAKALPGVLAVLTGQDLIDGGLGAMPAGMSFKNRDGSAMPKPIQMVLATDKVRFVGDPVAVVVAETAKQAKDGAEAVIAGIDSLPAVTEAAAAVAPGAPQLYDATPGNVILDFHHGDTEAVAAAFASAAHVTRLKIRNSRVVVCPMEPRSAIGEYDPEGERWTLRLGCQGVFGMRQLLTGPLQAPVEKIRVLTGNVGGSFGMKASCYPEYPAILYAAKLLGRPVKWTDERGESFLSDSHGRDHDMEQELALDADGRILALRITGYGNIGAYLSNGTVLQPTGNIVRNSIGVYATPLQEVSARAVFTNTSPVGPYRGAGRPEVNYYIERLLDTAAREMGIDRAEIRRRNHIQPEALPYTTPAGTTYDSGDFPTILDKALALADWDRFPARKQASAERGRLRGIGIGQYLEVTGPPAPEMGGIRFEDDGTVTIVTGTLDYGQGHASPFAQVLAARLGIPFEKIALLQGDSDQLLAGGGTGGSKSLMASGTAIVEAADLVRENGRRIAAHVLEAAEADIEFEVVHGGGQFRIAGTDRTIGLMDLAKRLREGRVTLPDGVPPTLSVSHVANSPPFAYPNGCHVAEVEVDPETGVAEVVRYGMVNDFGVVVNPLLVEGQAHGGIVQGIGQCFLEHVVYDDNGQPLTGSYMDYALPRANDAPFFTFTSHPVPAKTNVLGSKGCGEAGCAGSLPSVMNALVDALSGYGIRHIDMPATPLRVWEAIQAAG
ncbi:xanthine dehydrogenase family protein molybdopterin-binding subunit [Rhodopila globiformis]|uniref:Carbon monoxide dehydrogenase n=1 Tax=Rhodopila globiformis TaxID=1071 RepID=A0A2S6N8X5_RHOGL|nr:xanthine dehydrogenase family protein molybdopterin-binding subunit [Rhodopila globiformis]PPQ31064.1 carbon monoxide dehydrogenase [Rhodopila globiformis]